MAGRAGGGDPLESLRVLERAATQHGCFEAVRAEDDPFPPLRSEGPKRIAPTSVVSSTGASALANSDALDPALATRKQRRSRTAWVPIQQASVKKSGGEADLHFDQHAGRIGAAIADGSVERTADALARLASLLSSHCSDVALAASLALAQVELVLISAGPSAAHAISTSHVLQRRHPDVASRLRDHAHRRAPIASIAPVSLPFRESVESNSRGENEDKTRRNNREAKLRDVLHSCISTVKAGQQTTGQAAADFQKRAISAALPSNLQWLAHLFITRAADAAARGGEADEDVAQVAGSADKLARLSSRFNPEGKGTSTQLDGSKQSSSRNQLSDSPVSEPPKQQLPSFPTKFASGNGPAKQQGRPPKGTRNNTSDASVPVLFSNFSPSETQTFAALLEQSDSHRLSKAASHSARVAIYHIERVETIGSSASGTLEQKLRVLRCLGSLLGIASLGVVPDDAYGRVIDCDDSLVGDSLLDSSLFDWESILSRCAWQVEIMKLAVADARFCLSPAFRQRLAEAYALWDVARGQSQLSSLAAAFSFIVEGLFSHLETQADDHVAHRTCQEALSDAYGSAPALHEELMMRKPLHEASQRDIEPISSHFLISCCPRLQDVATFDLKPQEANTANSNATRRAPIRRAQPTPRDSVQDALRASFLSVHPELSQAINLIETQVASALREEQRSLCHQRAKSLLAKNRFKEDERMYEEAAESAAKEIVISCQQNVQQRCGLLQQMLARGHYSDAQLETASATATRYALLRMERQLCDDAFNHLKALCDTSKMESYSVRQSEEGSSTNECVGSAIADERIQLHLSLPQTPEGEAIVKAFDDFKVDSQALVGRLQSVFPFSITKDGSDFKDMEMEGVLLSEALLTPPQWFCQPQDEQNALVSECSYILRERFMHRWYILKSSADIETRECIVGLLSPIVWTTIFSQPWVGWTPYLKHQAHAVFPICVRQALDLGLCNDLDIRTTIEALHQHACVWSHSAIGRSIIDASSKAMLAEAAGDARDDDA